MEMSFEINKISEFYQFISQLISKLWVNKNAKNSSNSWVRGDSCFFMPSPLIDYISGTYGTSIHIRYIHIYTIIEFLRQIHRHCFFKLLRASQSPTQNANHLSKIANQQDKQQIKNFVCSTVACPVEGEKSTDIMCHAYLVVGIIR